MYAFFYKTTFIEEEMWSDIYFDTLKVARSTWLRL